MRKRLITPIPQDRSRDEGWLDLDGVAVQYVPNGRNRRWQSAAKITQPEKRHRSIQQANQLNLKRIEAVEDDEYPLSSYAS